MTDAFEDHEGTVSIGGRPVTNLRFADDIDGSALEEEELANLVQRFDKVSTAYGIKISAEKIKLMVNNTFHTHLFVCFVGNHEVKHQHQPIRVIKHLYDKATSAVLFNSGIED